MKAKYRVPEKFNIRLSLIIKSFKYDPHQLVDMLTEKAKLDEIYKDLDDEEKEEGGEVHAEKQEIV